jgi:hypothetical protein
MKQRHHTPEQVIRKLAEGEKLLNQGHDVAEVITQSTWHRWRRGFGIRNSRRLARSSSPNHDKHGSRRLVEKCASGCEKRTRPRSLSFIPSS